MWIVYGLLLAVGVLLVAALVLALCASAMIGRPFSERKQRVTILSAGDPLIGSARRHCERLFTSSDGSDNPHFYRELRDRAVVPDVGQEARCP